MKGSGCSRSGRLYELTVYNIVKNAYLNDNVRPFNTQPVELLGGSSSNNDIECISGDIPIPIEIKKSNTPDWMQCVLKYDASMSKWDCGKNNKIPDESKELFRSLIENAKLFDGKIPPFVKRGSGSLTHGEWVNIKKNGFKDTYLPCPNDTIMKLYANKGCKYIQISKKGLYHLGDDICKFNVPAFICNQRLRIRTKVHRARNKMGICVLSVIIACQPTNLKKLDHSAYTLDDSTKLPINLHYTPLDT